MKYNGSLTREQFMFQEMRIVARLKLEGVSDEEIARRIFEENLFQYPTERVIKSKCRACLERIECIWDMTAIVEALASGTYREAKQAAFIAMMCQSQLLAEFMVRVIGEKYRNLDMTVTRKDMNIFFQYLMEQDEHVADWANSTVDKIKMVIRNCLMEAEYIENVHSEVLLPVTLSPEFQMALRDAGHREFLPAFNTFD